MAEKTCTHQYQTLQELTVRQDPDRNVTICQEQTTLNIYEGQQCNDDHYGDAGLENLRQRVLEVYDSYEV